MGFASPDEFREVMDKTFALMSGDPEVGPKLREAPQRLEFPDVELAVNLRSSREDEEGALAWNWSDAPEGDPRVRTTMASDTANAFFQGKENLALAMMRGTIRTGGDVKTALALLPATAPVFARYRELVEAEYPHLAV